MDTLTTCAHCRFFMSTQDDDDRGTCLRYPPVVHTERQVVHGYTEMTTFQTRPRVRDVDTCGEWRAT
jgi:hypothetical protein